jgi:hypothetical protein
VAAEGGVAFRPEELDEQLAGVGRSR